MKKESRRILVLSHGHPSFSIGGAETASYNLHRGLGELPGCESFYLARVGPPVARHRDTAFLSLRQREREALIFANHYDYFRLSNRDLDMLDTEFTRYLRDVRPDLVHFHHFLGFGVEAAFTVRKALPAVPIVATLHEYIAICHHHGQMVKTQRLTLCSRSSPADCAMCFPEIPASAFMKRELFLKSFYGLVDCFVSPSRFLAERYGEWGLPRRKLRVLENGLQLGDIAPPRPIAAQGGRRNRFAYFGQLNEFKGVKVLLDAVTRVPPEDWGPDGVLNIFGGNLEIQPVAFQNEFKRLVGQVGRRVRFHGSYRAAELPTLMKEVDWVVVPSIWWENSPVVIQEAFAHGRPVICSDIGGMAEKVRHAVDGLHFRAGSAESLADRMVQVLRQPGLWDRLRARIRKPLTARDAAEQHLALYQALWSGAEPHAARNGDRRESTSSPHDGVAAAT